MYFGGAKYYDVLLTLLFLISIENSFSLVGFSPFLLSFKCISVTTVTVSDSVQIKTAIRLIYSEKGIVYIKEKLCVSVGKKQVCIRFHSFQPPLRVGVCVCVCK